MLVSNVKDYQVHQIYKIVFQFVFNFFDFSTGADSLCYLSVDGLKRAVQYNMKSKNRAHSGHCTACLTGEYPGGLPEELSW